MIVRSGLALTFPIMFTSGLPIGGVTWTLYGSNGEVLETETAAVPSGAVSLNITVSATLNTLTGGALTGHRDLEWAYEVADGVVSGAQRYSLEARAPLGVANDGVRAKLGVEAKDLPDGDISLIRAYLYFRSLVGADRLAEVTDEAALLTVRDAIEAQAALSLIPTMAVRVAVQEDSGTNMYKRQAVDWEAIAASLSDLVHAGIVAVIPEYDPTPTGALFILARPASDPITGGSYT